MKIAFTLNQEEEAVPITEANVIRIYDAGSLESTDYPNPAKEAQAGKRSATLRFVIEKGVVAIVAPPETLCEVSYRVAREHELAFVLVESNEPFLEIVQKKFVYKNELPEEEILPSL